ncbi:MAG: ABC transporter permease [Coprobacillus sp.]
MIEFLNSNGVVLLQKISEHLFISISALLLGVLVAVPLGILLTNTKRIAQLFISICSVLQTIPSLALLAIMVPFFGVGKLPAIVALFIYSLLPILRNTYLGMMGVDKGLLDAAKGMGMTRTQIIIKVQLPLAIPVIMSGIRLSAVYVIAWATIAAYIGAGGLGDFIFAGLNNFDFSFILGGTIPVTVLALILDLSLGKLEKFLIPRTTSKKEIV